MDLEQELLAALDNPSAIWESLVANYSNETRTTLLVFTTCSKPTPLTAWQEALGRVSLSAAGEFYKHLRILDDSFVTTRRMGPDSYVADFRNPSTDDFCLAYLDKNIGVVTSIASEKPTLSQITRLVDAGLASATRISLGSEGRYRYPGIHGTVIGHPDLLTKRLIELFEGDQSRTDRGTTILRLIDLYPSRSQDLTGKLTRFLPILQEEIMSLRFDEGRPSLYSILDDRRRAKATARILGESFDEFYDLIADSAYDLSHFDSLVAFDEALGRSGRDASWADKFESLTQEWLENANSVNEAESDRDYYSRVAGHLSLEDRSREGEWEEVIEGLTQEPDGEADESWAEDSDREWQNIVSERMAAEREIDAMFEGLVAREHGPL